LRFNSRVSSPAPDPAASATRQAILAAAKSLLAEQGRDALNMSRVARRARINRGTTYLHYASREALLLDTLKDVSRELCAEVFPPDSALVDNDPDRWLDGAERLARFAMAKPALGQIWLNYILTSDAAAKDPFWKQWMDANRRLASTGRSRPGIDQEVLAVMLLSTYFVWPVWVEAHTPAGSSREAMARRLARETVRLLRHGVLRDEAGPQRKARAARKRVSRRPRRRAGAISGT
jgi:AcrR family transcriptional regulator